MENASKALIIAGEVLVGLLVLSLMVSLFVTFGKFSANMHEKLSSEQIIQFNNNFYQYDGRINITAHDIVTTINFVKQTNDARELEYDTREDSPYYTTVKINGDDFFSSNKYVNSSAEYNDLTQTLNEFLNGQYYDSSAGKSYSNNTLYFCCNVNYKLENGNPGVNEEKEYNYMYLSNSTRARYQYKDNGDIKTDNNSGGTGLVTEINFHTVVPPSKFNITIK